MTLFAPLSREREVVVWSAYEAERDDAPHLWTWTGNAYRTHTWDDWRAGARRHAAGLRRIGVEPGARVASVLTNTWETMATVVGTWLAGAVMLSLPTLRRGQTVEDYVVQLRRVCRHSGAQVLLLERRFVELLGDADLGVPVHAYEDLADDGPFEEEPLGYDDLAFVQYSSGSTSDPKGCMLTMGAISEQVEMLRLRLDVDGDSRGLMWLPLSHDMGLFGCLILSWSSGMRMVVGTPERFLRRPRTWFDDMAELETTITAAPNFALSLAARTARRSMPRGHVGSLRTLVLGGERIEWRTLRDAVEVLGPVGLRTEALTPAYGLAEATLAVTMKRFGDRPSAISVDRAELYRGNVRPRPYADETTVDLVSCGPPMDGVEVWIEGGEGVGHVWLRSDSLSAGYLNDEERTRGAFLDGGFRTADLGFMAGGELYVVGRADDVLVIGGVNVNARDAEVAVEDCEGVRPGTCVLVDVPDGDSHRLVVVAEPARDARDFEAVADEIAGRVYSLTGVRPEQALFISPGQLPKTPSGKIQRFRTRALIMGGDARFEARVEL